MPKTRLLLRLGLDALAWYCIPAVFLLVYVNRYSVPVSSVAPHIKVVAFVLLSLVLIRAGLYLAIRNRTARLFATALAAAAFVGIMVLYYGLVLIGLHSWGRVISSDLIISYAAQAPELADTLGISLILVTGATVLMLVILFAAAWIYFRHLDWIHEVARSASRWTLALCLVAGCAVWAGWLYGFLAFPPTREYEPVSLTLYPLEGSWMLQGHVIDGLAAAKLDRLEEAARASYHPVWQTTRRNLILIVVDALRPDHMGLYGYERDTTPNLSRIAKTGSLRRARPLHSSCSSSSCGLLSMSSSKFVHQFSNHPFTLQQVLKRHGYRVHMILGGDHTNFYNLKQSYGEVDSYFDGNSARRLNYMNDDQFILDRLAEFPDSDGTPVMMQLHLMAVHVLGKRRAETSKYSPAANYGYPEGRDAGEAGHPGVRNTNYYDNGVVQADATIQDILHILEGKGYLKDALVAITADHGESLGEHNLFQHQNSVREEVLQIPLVLLSYGYKATRSIDGPPHPSQVDIAPTILLELGLPLPETWSGTALQSRQAREFTYFQERLDVGLLDHRDPHDLWKYWVNTESGREYAFNLDIDPKEQDNVVAAVPKDRLRQWRREVLPGSTVLVWK